MRLSCLAIALAFLVSFTPDSWGQSNQPTPPPTQPTQANQTSKPYERGTEEDPVIIKILPTKDSKEKTAADSHHEDEKTENDRRLALFTERLFLATVALSVIAFFQLVIFGWQGIQLKRTVSAAKEATELGNREFIATHRPKLRIRRIVPNRPFVPGQRATASIEVANIGTSEATVEQLGIDIFITDPFNAAPVPIARTPIPPGKQAIFEVVGQNLTQVDITRIETGADWLRLMGVIAYSDANLTPRNTSFARRYDHIWFRFRNLPDDDPEADREFED
jgi:hypothetical protein